MAFVIRTLSHSAAGREIARVRRIAGDTLTVGRDPASDIHLPDLAVTRHHAVLRLDAAGCVSVDAAEELPIEIDGRSAKHGTIDLVRGGEIVLGAFRLVVDAGEVPGDATILVERIGTAANAPKDERQRFSLVGVAPGKRKVAWMLTIAILAAFLAWPIWSFHSAATARLSPAQIAGAAANRHADAAWSPGKLSLAHAGLESNCIACHKQAFVAVSDAACRSCHTAVHDHADPARLAAARSAPDFGGRVRLAVARTFGRSEGRCADCHQEHLGPVAMAPTPERFCSECHADLKANLSDTILENASDFGTAHPEFRPAVLQRAGSRPVVERISLASAPKQNSGLKFPHAVHLSSASGVARMAQSLGQAPGAQGLQCASCHVADAHGSFRPVGMEANCQSCHSLAFARADGTVRRLPHGDPRQAVGELKDFFAANRGTPLARPVEAGRRRPGDFAATSRRLLYGEAVADRGNQATRAIHALFAPHGACADCHMIVPPARAGDTDFGIAPVTIQASYLSRSVFDHRVHATQSCSSCHAATASNNARDVLLPKIAQCRGCHAGETTAHRGQVPSSCALCHGFHLTMPEPDTPMPRRPAEIRIKPREG